MKTKKTNILVKTLFIILMGVMSILPLYVFADNTTYYIDPANGNDNNNGTSQSTPCSEQIPIPNPE